MTTTDRPGRADAPIERHYKPEEIAEQWQISVETVRRLFNNEPGVLKIGEQKRNRRAYFTLRIPESVLDRVQRRMRVA